MPQSFTRRADALAHDSYYEASVTRPPTDDPVLDGAIDVDVCVIGAGSPGCRRRSNAARAGCRSR